MALDFPNTPAIGEVYSGAGLSWMWDGTKWVTGTSGGFAQPMLVANATTTLPVDFAGFVRVENNTGGPITITLPAPVAAREITVKDCYGNAGTYPITVTGGGPSIEGAVSLTISFNYGWVDLIYTGVMWVQA